MADIDIVKKRSRTWLWVVLAIIVAAVLVFVFANGRSTRPGSGSVAPVGQPLAATTVGADRAA